MSTRKYGILQVREDFTWRVSDCEELVGVTYRRRCGVIVKLEPEDSVRIQSINPHPLKSLSLSLAGNNFATSIHTFFSLFLSISLILSLNPVNGSTQILSGFLLFCVTEKINIVDYNPFVVSVDQQPLSRVDNQYDNQRP